MILLDTSGVLAAIDRASTHHGAASRLLATADPPFLLSPFVLAELDYLLATRVGSASAWALLEEVARGAYRLEPFGPDDVLTCIEVMKRYADLDAGLADASIVVLAERHAAHDVLTLDQRHFRVLKGPAGRHFRLLPVDL